MPPGAPWRCRGRRDGHTVRAVSCMRGRRSRAARARPSSRGVHALPRVFLFRPSPKVGVNPFYLSNDRIHDFHRFGCVPPDPKYHMVLYGGPSKLVANQGAAVLAILSEGPKFTLTYRYDARCGTPHR